MRKLVFVLLLVLPGCSFMRAAAKQPYLGEPLTKYIEIYGIPDRERKLDEDLLLSQWDTCKGEGDTDVNGKYSSAYSCKHRIVISKNGLIQSIKMRD